MVPTKTVLSSAGDENPMAGVLANIHRDIFVSCITGYQTQRRPRHRRLYFLQSMYLSLTSSWNQRQNTRTNPSTDAFGSEHYSGITPSTSSGRRASSVIEFSSYSPQSPSTIYGTSSSSSSQGSLYNGPRQTRRWTILPRNVSVP